MVDNTAILRALADRLLIRGDYSAPGQEPSYSDVADATACTESADEIERLRARVAEAERDAARYRWLRMNGGDYRVEQKDGYGGTMLKCEKILDDAIDAARAADSATSSEDVVLKDFDDPYAVMNYIAADVRERDDDA